ncbi:uncharacterized protein ACR2FA_011717 [Aphomia sociella]
MRDNRKVMRQFVKIIERYPDLYDHNSDTYRRWCADKAWEKVVDCVKAELNEDCTVDELKQKWKGIRSSYNRYKLKLFKSKFETRPVQAYYLCNVLKFLDPFIKPKGIPENETLPEPSYESFCSETEDLEIDPSNNYDHSTEWTEVDIKSQKRLKTEECIDIYSESEVETSHSKCKKKKNKSKESDEDNEDLQFFRSILPDIKDFTSKEKRNLKRGILNLIDEIDNSRKNTEY